MTPGRGPQFMRPHSDGVVLALKVQPRARRTEIVGELGGRLKVAVSAPPVDGKANSELVKALSKWLGVPKSAVELLHGETGRDKAVLIHGVTPKKVLAAIL